MTSGFVCFGVGVPLFAFELRRSLPGRAWIAAVVSGLATLGVAAFPLHVSVAVDRLHGTFATIGYIALASVPLLAARTLATQGHRAAARASVIVAATAALCLLLTPIAGANGLFQRAGLTIVDVWLIGAAVTRQNRGR
jgi:4-hydroxybenzoate polyprenyltransferase